MNWTDGMKQAWDLHWDREAWPRYVVNDEMETFKDGVLYVQHNADGTAQLYDAKLQLRETIQWSFDDHMEHSGWCRSHVSPFFLAQLTLAVNTGAAQ